LSEKGSILPLSQDIIEDISTFISSGKIPPRLFGLWQNWWKHLLIVCGIHRGKNGRLLCQSELSWQSYGTLGIVLCPKWKMVKKEKCNYDKEEDNNSTISNTQKRKDMRPQIHINASHISTFSSYLKNVQDIQCKYDNILMLYSGNTKQAIIEMIKTKNR